MIKAGKNMHDLGDFDNPFERMKLEGRTCFLCGCQLEANDTQEHVFPKWLQRKYNLWNSKIHLLNGSLIPYRQLTIPCCHECNTRHLSKLEATVRTAVEGGYATFSSLDDLLIYQWVGKIFYGILFKELNLLLDRSNPEAGTIATRDLLTKFNNLHGLLQSIRRPTKFIGNKPYSVLVLHLYQPEKGKNYFFSDNLYFMTFSIQMGEIGIIVAFQDCNENQQTYTPYIEFVKGQGAKLYPIQFDELSAKITYRCKLLNRRPKFIFAIPKDVQEPFTVSCLLGGLESTPIFDQWDQAEFAFFLANSWQRWGIGLEDIFHPPNLVTSYMQDEKGDVIILPLDDGWS